MNSAATLRWQLLLFLDEQKMFPIQIPTKHIVFTTTKKVVSRIRVTPPSPETIAKVRRHKPEIHT